MIACNWAWYGCEQSFIVSSCRLEVIKGRRIRIAAIWISVLLKYTSNIITQILGSNREAFAFLFVSQYFITSQGLVWLSLVGIITFRIKAQLIFVQLDFHRQGNKLKDTKISNLLPDLLDKFLPFLWRWVVYFLEQTWWQMSVSSKLTVQNLQKEYQNRHQGSRLFSIQSKIMVIAISFQTPKHLFFFTWLSQSKMRTNKVWVQNIVRPWMTLD